MTLIDRVTEHFAGLNTVVIDVPEWGVSLHVPPPTLEKQMKFLKAADKGNDILTAIEALLLFAKDADGAPAFTLEDKQKLLKSSDPAVVGRVAGEVANAHNQADPLV